jgi:hypothetical protein
MHARGYVEFDSRRLAPTLDGSVYFEMFLSLFDEEW